MPVCSAGAQGVGWKCRDLPSSTLEESFPRVIKHLPRAKRASTRNSSWREFLGGGVAAPHVLLPGGRGWRGGAAAAWVRPPRASARGAGSWGTSSHFEDSPGPPTTHPGDLVRGRPPTQPELCLGLTWRLAFLFGNSSSVDLHLVKQSVLACSSPSVFLTHSDPHHSLTSSSSFSSPPPAPVSTLLLTARFKT